MHLDADGPVELTDKVTIAVVANNGNSAF
jgi:RNA polymerase sigma-70 factor (ECF subfamily)